MYLLLNSSSLSFSLSPYYRKPTNRVTDTDQLEHGEYPILPSQTQPQTRTTIDLSMVAPNLGAMTTDPADIMAQGGNNQIQLPGTHQNLTLQANSNRPVRLSDLCIPGQNGSVATQKRSHFTTEVYLWTYPQDNRHLPNHHTHS